MRSNLKDARRKMMYTQQEMSERVGISRSHYANIERGEHEPNYKTSEKIRKTLRRTKLQDDLFDIAKEGE